MNDKILVLLGRSDAALHQKVREMSPRLEIVTVDKLKELPEILPQIEIVYGGLKREDIPKATGLRWYQNSGAGVNGLITPEMRDSDLIVTNVSGIHARPITEHMFGMLLSVTRALTLAWDGQKQREWKHLGGKVESLEGKTLGILGVGAIGEQSARVGKAFGMRVVGIRRSGQAHPDIEEMFTPETRLDFFARSNVVMNLLPLTEKTRGFMADAEFEALPQGAIVVNAGRGATIDTQALLRALRGGKLKAALLDVTDPEPLPADHPLWSEPGVFITPHYSGAHPEYDQRADEIFLDNLRLYLAGEPLHHEVDKAEGY
jgi:phosphoglycerate dehydrogenase-like enzyme